MDRQFRVVQQLGIFCWLQGCGATGGVPGIAGLEVGAKRRDCSRNPLGQELLLAALCPLVGAGRQEHLEARLRENHRAHVTSVCHQAGQASKTVLQCQQGGAHLGQCRDPGCVHAGLFGADGLCHILAVHVDHVTGKYDVERARQRGQGRFIQGVECQAGPPSGQGGNAVQRARVQKVVAQAARQRRRQRAFARGGGSVDANHRHGASGGLCQRKQGLKVVRESFGHALGVFDAHRQAGRVEGRQREAHRDAVVVVGVDAGRAPVGRAGGRCHAQEIGAFFHAGTQFAQLGGHGRNAVGFLDPPTRDVSQCGGALRVQRHHCQRHGGIGDVVAVQVNRLQGPALARFAAPDVQPVGAAVDLRTHQACRLNEADIALDRVLAQALNFYAILAVRPRAYCA